MARKNPTTYHVAPRWTSGSPAMVDEQLALRVAAEEREAHSRALDHRYGDERATEARGPKALRYIAEERVERGSGWLVTDLITGDKWFRLPALKIATLRVGTGDKLSFWLGTIVQCHGEILHLERTLQRDTRPAARPDDLVVFTNLVSVRVGDITSVEEICV